MRGQVKVKLILVSMLLYCSTCFGQDKPISSVARQQIDAGNQEWIDGMKLGDIALLVDGYAADAVDCGPEGGCTQGRAALEEHVKRQMAKLGKANSASVVSIGSVQQGRYVYEWGEAKAHFPNGKSIVDRYLTVWHEQPDGSWKIFRNLVIPGK